MSGEVVTSLSWSKAALAVSACLVLGGLCLDFFSEGANVSPSLVEAVNLVAWFFWLATLALILGEAFNTWGRSVKARTVLPYLLAWAAIIVLKLSLFALGVMLT